MVWLSFYKTDTHVMSTSNHFRPILSSSLFNNFLTILFTISMSKMAHIHEYCVYTVQKACQCTQANQNKIGSFMNCDGNSKKTFTIENTLKYILIILLKEYYGNIFCVCCLLFGFSFLCPFYYYLWLFNTIIYAL